MPNQDAGTQARRRIIIKVLSLLLALALGACALPHGYKGEPGGQGIQIQPLITEKRPARGMDLDAYRISPGDIIEFIFRQDSAREDTFRLSPLDTVNVNFLANAEWNSQQRIRPDGTIALPYQPSVAVAGLTVPQATQKLEELYSQILQNPRIFLYVADFKTRQERLHASLLNPSAGASRLLAVQADGYVSLPFAGMVRAGGLTFVDFRQLVQNQYQQQYGMDVDVLLNKPANQMLYLVGMLTQPGAYPINGPISVLQALSLARGFRDDAQLNQVILIRREGDTMFCTPLDLTATMEGRNTDGMALARSGDIIYVPRTRLASAADVANQLTSITFFKGVSASLSWQMRNNETQYRNNDEVLPQN